jgi:hypothetical protein
MELKDIIERLPKYIKVESEGDIMYSEKLGKYINVEEEVAGEMQSENVAMAPGSWY